MARLGKCSGLTAFATVAATVVTLVTGTARATDQGITGKKLLIKSTKFVLLSRDPSISATGSNPVTGADSSITFNGGSGPVSLSLPKTLWRANKAASAFKY